MAPASPSTSLRSTLSFVYYATAFEPSATSIVASLAAFMYRCHFCGATVAPRTPATRIAIETRVRHYPARPNAVPVRRQTKTEWVDDPGGEGVEIVREAFACPSCAACKRPTE